MLKFICSLILLGVLGCSEPQSITPEMPIIVSYHVWSGPSPIERRDSSVYKYLTNSYRIENKQGSASVFGSGTLCWYDSKNNIGYIISCGHLFNGGEKQVGIDVFYKNKVKLSKPERFVADVICYSKTEDISFLKFKPNWIPEEYFPIAPISMSPSAGTKLISAGCDGAREVAAYDITVIGLEGKDLVTKENSPRHGRSGGGLMNDKGYYLGICWGSSDPYNGTGTGMFVPLFRIHRYAKLQNLSFLLELDKEKIDMRRILVDKIPIIDHSMPQKSYSKGYIPIP